MSISTILLVEDNEGTLSELMDTLPTIIGDQTIKWELCSSFDEAQTKITINRYDLIVTDIYIDTRGQKRSFSIEETGAGEAIKLVRSTRFCPILAMTDGSKPEQFPVSPFIGFADKSNPASITEGLQALLNTGLPQLARRVHDEIDKDVSHYLWDFLEENWDSINRDSILLERLIRRRASILISRINTEGETYDEIEAVEGLEFYIYPPIANNSLRLGEILRKNGSAKNEFVVVLTPHCHLTIQPGDESPRAEYVLTVGTVTSRAVFSNSPITTTNETKLKQELRRRIQGPAQVGRPDGRYWFLPGFLEIPDLYCDFLQVNSISYSDLKNNYESIAVLDTPFAESLQGAFTAFYSAVGTPNLNPDRFNHLLDVNER